MGPTFLRLLLPCSLLSLSRGPISPRRSDSLLSSPKPSPRPPQFLHFLRYPIGSTGNGAAQFGASFLFGSHCFPRGSLAVIPICTARFSSFLPAASLSPPFGAVAKTCFNLLKLFLVPALPLAPCLRRLKWPPKAKSSAVFRMKGNGEIRIDVSPSRCHHV
jgi:hypothetical protein